MLLKNRWIESSIAYGKRMWMEKKTLYFGIVRYEERKKMFSDGIIEKTESDRLQLAFIISDEGRQELIAEYGSKLWKRSQYSADVFEELSYIGTDHSSQRADHFLLADGTVWKQCGEPAYYVYLDGSVKISVEDSESDIYAFKRFNALQYDEALLTARRIAHGNGEQKKISFCPIQVYLPYMVKTPLNPEYASLYDIAGLRIPTIEEYSTEQVNYLAHFMNTDRFEVKRIKGKGSDALFLVGDKFWKKQKNSEYEEYFRKHVTGILNDTALKPVPVECQLGDTVIWFGSWQVSKLK